MPSRRPSREKSRTISLGIKSYSESKTSFNKRVDIGSKQRTLLDKRGFKFVRVGLTSPIEIKDQIKKFKSTGHKVATVTAPRISIFGGRVPSRTDIYIKKMK